jgi:hypothetical protein
MLKCRMANARDRLEQQFLEMRWRALSLAADLDRIERAEGGKELIASDPRLAKLREAIQALTQVGDTGRAERVQMIFSDMSPPPARK